MTARALLGCRAVLLALAIAAPCRAAEPMPEPSTAPLPAGTYRLDPAHASLLFRVAAFSLEPSGSRIGFSAKGSLLRSTFGVALGIPAPGSTIGVSDAVEVIIEAEFTRPAA